MENLQSELAGGCSQRCEFRKQYKQTSSGPERQREWWEFLQHLSMPMFRRPVSHQRFVSIGLLQLRNSGLQLPLIGFYHFSTQTQKERDWNVSISGTIDTKTAVQKIPAGFIFRCRLPEEGAATASDHHYSWCMQKWAFPDAPLQGSYRPLSQREENSGQFNIVV